MHLVELARFTDDVPAATAFYGRLLDREPTASHEGLATFDLDGDVTLLLHADYEPVPGEPPPADHAAFAVDDLEAAVADLETRGLELEIPPKDYDWGRSAYLRDPDGRLLELHEE